MDTYLMEYYQGSFETPEGFKGFAPHLTADETAYICQSIQHPEQYTQCKASTTEPPVSLILPAVGSSSGCIFVAAFVATLIGVAVWRKWGVLTTIALLGYATAGYLYFALRLY